MFDTEVFIRESNKIDPDYEIDGNFIPGNQAGDLLYDNQLIAIKSFPDLYNNNNNNNKPLTESVVLDLHRILTKNIKKYEITGNSGKYRRINVWIGGKEAPQPFLAQKILREILFPTITELRYKNISSHEAIKNAWWAHNLFEIAHPFVDGNGRTGRLLLNLILEMFGQEKIIVFYDNRFDYYKQIQDFRENEFPAILSNLSL